MGFVHLFNQCATDGRGERGFAQAARNDDYLFINDVEANSANLRFMPFEITLDVNEPEKMIKFWTTVLNYLCWGMPNEYKTYNYWLNYFTSK